MNKNKNVSAGLLMYKMEDDKIKIFLVHPGGPFFRNKDEGYWGIPKGLIEENEELLTAAKREFQEETGIIPQGDFIPLGFIKQKNGKIVHCWAFKFNGKEPIEIHSNTFSMEWPPKSGKIQFFQEIDKGKFFDVNEALIKINQAQNKFIKKLKELIKIS